MTTPADTWRQRATSFGPAARDYRRSRPGYPDAAVRWLVPTRECRGCRVLDLAAGTGKLTERLHALGYDVVAVEPSDGMRAELADAVPGVEALAGTAEEIPLPDGSVDAVIVATAWHWFDHARAVPEIARVLRPGGTLGVVWNVWDDRSGPDGWVHSFEAIIREGDALRPDRRGMVSSEVDGHFGPVERAEFPWEHRLAAGDLTTLAASRSHTLTLPPADRAALLSAVDDLVAHHPQLAGRAEIDVPYLAQAWRTARLH